MKAGYPNPKQDKITETNFRFSTNILRRLGEELNPSPSQGLIELVKNAYDADALRCIVTLSNTDSVGGAISIEDDGTGMGVEEIINGWLVLGKSEKILRGVTKLGRRPSGDKGLGRLSALRMSHRVSLKAVSIADPSVEHTLEIDWERYEDKFLVEDVDLRIITAMNLDGRKPGTRIFLESLKDRLSRNEIQKLARGLILLADPFGDNPTGFSPILKASEYEDLEKMVEAKYFRDADYHLEARLDKNGFAQAYVKDWRDETLYSGNHNDLKRKDKDTPYKCPKVDFDLWVFLLDRRKFTPRLAPQSDIQRWLGEFGGVHLYYNGLRVSPYGDKGDDWLGMNLMRVRSPEERPGTNTSVGRIVLTDTDKLFLQKTDRSGFIINDSFLELQLFAKDALNWMAKKRLAEAEKRRLSARSETPKRSEKEKTTVQEAISEVPEAKRKQVESAFAKYDRARESEVNELRKEVQLYRTLSTIGITSAVFAHESANNPLKLINQSLGTIKNRCKTYLGDKYDEYFKDPIDRIYSSIESLKVLSSVTLSLVDHDKRRASRVEIHSVIRNTLELYKPFITDRQVKVETQLAEGNPYLRGSIAAIESIIANVLNNSLVFFEKNPPGDRRIVVRTKIIEDELELRILDNGPGIEGIDKMDIWLPGQTTRPNGTGLGLTIVRDAAVDLGGSVDAIEKGELGGAEIIIILPVLGV